MGCNLVLTVGNAMMGDDGAGPYLADKLQAAPLPSWIHIDGGIAPENVVYKVRELQPERVVLVDAAEIGEKADTLQVIPPETIAEMFIFSTHNMPLNFLIDELKAFVPEVIFVGVQPAIVAFSFPMTEMVIEAMDYLYQHLDAAKDTGLLIDKLDNWNIANAER
ncbi:TPA: hydrogenase maturation peptidase HycI [Aeromonas veronii]|nr:hydrogenase maturation peptidase HycI [Aeromonas veronii]HDO1344628.1 hydrogenase maturation peptidase HycI [Aeromonas veronii]HDO1349188.1 hydrogenase maturation peptidase HycI [Aeromonas veronii]HDO1353599.1 hydrogenase maturation peptidase HycI [Aeromonas veronii]HDO1362931.1 hydrogenase maturation peptidase HycI [Aeromonas veronii]